MKCPYCFREIPFSTVCPACGRELHFGGNTQFLAEVQQGRLGVKDIFAQTLKRHPKGDAFRSLTRRPALTAEMLETWQRPWMFLRLFVMLLIKLTKDWMVAVLVGLRKPLPAMMVSTVVIQ